MRGEPEIGRSLASCLRRLRMAWFCFVSTGWRYQLMRDMPTNWQQRLVLIPGHSAWPSQLFVSVKASVLLVQGCLQRLNVQRLFSDQLF
jgi:hypothetical protein